MRVDKILSQSGPACAPDERLSGLPYFAVLREGLDAEMDTLLARLRDSNDPDDFARARRLKVARRRAAMALLIGTLRVAIDDGYV